MNVKKHIPNLITLANLFCGCIAIIFVSRLDFEKAFFFVCFGIFLDFFDGFFARLFKVSSPLGLQLDSLADMVTSGLVPGFTMFQLFQMTEYDSEVINKLSVFGFIITLGACYRLANFNIDTRQTNSFIGLPTPANALFIMSLPLIIIDDKLEVLTLVLTNHWFLVVITLLSAFIMNAEIPLFSLKFKSKNVKDNLLQIIFLTISILLLLIFKFFGVALVILFYVLLSVVMNIFSKNTISK